MLEVVREDSVSHRRALAEIAGLCKVRFAEQTVLATPSDTRACW